MRRGKQRTQQLSEPKTVEQFSCWCCMLVNRLATFESHCLLALLCHRESKPVALHSISMGTLYGPLPWSSPPPSHTRIHTPPFSHFYSPAFPLSLSSLLSGWGRSGSGLPPHTSLWKSHSLPQTQGTYKLRGLRLRFWGRANTFKKNTTRLQARRRRRENLKGLEENRCCLRPWTRVKAMTRLSRNAWSFSTMNDAGTENVENFRRCIFYKKAALKLKSVQLKFEALALLPVMPLRYRGSDARLVHHLWPDRRLRERTVICGGAYLRVRGRAGRAAGSPRHQPGLDAGLAWFNFFLLGLLNVKSCTLTLKTLHSEETEWVSSFLGGLICYRILLYVKGAGLGWDRKRDALFFFSPPHLHTHTHTHKLRSLWGWKIICCFFLPTQHSDTPSRADCWFIWLFSKRRSKSY